MSRKVWWIIGAVAVVVAIAGMAVWAGTPGPTQTMAVPGFEYNNYPALTADAVTLGSTPSFMLPTKTYHEPLNGAPGKCWWESITTANYPSPVGSTTAIVAWHGMSATAMVNGKSIVLPETSTPKYVIVATHGDTVVVSVPNGRDYHSMTRCCITYF